MVAGSTAGGLDKAPYIPMGWMGLGTGIPCLVQTNGWVHSLSGNGSRCESRLILVIPGRSPGLYREATGAYWVYGLAEGGVLAPSFAMELGTLLFVAWGIGLSRGESVSALKARGYLPRE